MESPTFVFAVAGERLVANVASSGNRWSIVALLSCCQRLRSNWCRRDVPGECCTCRMFQTRKWLMSGCGVSFKRVMRWTLQQVEASTRALAWRTLEKKSGPTRGPPLASNLLAICLKFSSSIFSHRLFFFPSTSNKKSVVTTVANTLQHRSLKHQRDHFKSSVRWLFILLHLAVSAP